MAGAERTHPLGKNIRIRINRKYDLLGTRRGHSRSSVVEGCKLPPIRDVSADSGLRRECYVSFGYISLGRHGPSKLDTSSREKMASLQGTVRWNETIDM